MSAPADVQATLGALNRELAPDLEVLRLIGDGSAARVFLGREPALRRLVAIKVLRDDLAGDDVARRRFEREAGAAASIPHRNITAIHRVGQLRDGRPFIVMEHVDGRTLRDLLVARGPLPPGEATRVLTALAAALAAAHQGNVVHRDVRPANVIIEAETGRVVLMDFGIAAVLETGSEAVTRLTEAGVRLGHLEHMSPEQLRGDPVTPMSDVWGLGALGYEMLTGRGPFGGRSLAERLASVLEDDPPPLDDLGPDADPRLAVLLRRCLAREPAHRPRAREVLDELRRPAPAPPAVLANAAPARATGDVLPGPLRDFLSELKRRRVYRVAAGYVAGAFLVLEAADLVAPLLAGQRPGFWFRVVAAITVAGFPIALVLSWAFDVNPDAARDPARPFSLRRRILPVLGLALSIVAAVAVWLMLMR